MATPPPVQELAIRTGGDVVRVRQAVRALAETVRLSLVEQTKLVTAASELARNTLVHGGSGTVRAQLVHRDRRVGVRLVFQDHGPGIPDVGKALTDGFSTGPGLGLGLGGSRRLVDEFDLQTAVGQGTTVTVVSWTR